MYEKGSFYYKDQLYFLSDVLGGRDIALIPTKNDGIFAIYYGHVPIASLDLHARKIQAAPNKEALEK